MRKVAAIFPLILIILIGCRNTKYIPEGDYLLNSVTIQSDNNEIKPNDANPFVKQKANTKILGVVKFHLWLYNRSPKNGDGWLTRALRKSGEAPIVYDDDLTVQSEREILRYLSNKGFTQAEISSREIYNERKGKVDVIYDMTCNIPFRLAQTDVDIQDTAIAKIVMRDADKSLLVPGDRFDLDVLDAERERLAATLKNEGYYDFNKQEFTYNVDTTVGAYMADDVLILKVDTANPQRSFEQYHVGDITFVVGYDAKKALKNIDAYLASMDVVKFKGMTFLSEGKADLKPEILYRNTLIKSGVLYNKSLSDRTHSLLSAIDFIRYVNINYKETEGNILDCMVYISLAEPQAFSMEVEGTNISGNFGGAIKAGYAHKNLFRGAEQLTTNVTVGQEAIIGLGDNGVSNSRELSVDSKLSFPKFVFPFLDEDFRQKSRSTTEFGLSFNFQERPEYKRNIATANMVYSWRNNKSIRHQLTPLMLNYISIPEMSDNFAEQIDTTEYLKYSYQDHVIFGTRYGITFQGGRTNKGKKSRYLNLVLEGSGNMLSTFNAIAGKDKVEAFDEEGNLEDSYYDFLNVRYSQYVKFDATGVINHDINKSNTMAYRAQFGIGIPYRNSTQLPFEKRYFGGGANGVRAWMVRSLGPGSYNNDEVNYYNQSGDINLVMSAEYRFKLFWMLEGAFFADAGNTWTIRDYSDQPGAVFAFDTFYKQIAVGVGTGLRIDLNFFVFRLDMAFKAVDPTMPVGDRWVLGTDLGPTTHFAIGYPF